MTLRSIPSALQNHLDKDATTLALCWKITRTDGVIYRFTDADKKLEISGEVYTPLNAGTSSAIEGDLDTDPNNLELEVILDSDEIDVDELNRGFFDNAEVELFLVNYLDTTQGIVTLLKGYFGQVEMQDDYKGKISLQSLSTRLSETVGRIYTQQCDAELGDSRCGVDTSSYTYNGSVTSQGTHTRLEFTDDSVVTDGYYKYGVLTWTSGDNDGFEAKVKEQDSSGNFTLLDPMLYEINVGDGYSVYAGCNKYFSTCKSKFDNHVNFRGFPHVPGRDAITKYPDSNK